MEPEKPNTELAVAGPILLTMVDGEPRASTETIAEGVGVQHPSVMRLVRKHLKRLEKFGLVGFEIRARQKGQHGGGNAKLAMLNEHQAALLLTLMDNTEKAMDFKEALVFEFFRMRDALRTLSESLSVELKDLKTITRDAKELGTTGSHLFHVVKRAKKFVDGRLKDIKPQLSLFDGDVAQLEDANKSTRQRAREAKAKSLAAPPQN